MQIELLKRRPWTTRLELSLAMVDWIEGCPAFGTISY